MSPLLKVLRAPSRPRKSRSANSSNSRWPQQGSFWRRRGAGRMLWRDICIRIANQCVDNRTPILNRLKDLVGLLQQPVDATVSRIRRWLLLEKKTEYMHIVVNLWIANSSRSDEGRVCSRYLLEQAVDLLPAWRRLLSNYFLTLTITDRCRSCINNYNH